MMMKMMIMISLCVYSQIWAGRRGNDKVIEISHPHLGLLEGISARCDLGGIVKSKCIA